LAVLRRSDIVTTRHGTTVDALADGDVVALIRAARRILAEMRRAEPSCWPRYAHR
jgi:hypothetical protein